MTQELQEKTQISRIFSFSDDSCRVDECNNDGGDCDEENQCADESYCATGYDYWNILIGSSSKINHTDFCTLYWDLVGTLVGQEPPEECLYYMEKYDYSKDGMLNFREGVPLVYDAVWADWKGNPRGGQLNCSSCIGMDLYNI